MSKTLKYIIGVVAAVVALLLLWYFRDIVIYMIVAAVISIIGRPLTGLFKRIRIKNFRVPNWLAALLSILTILLVAVTFFALFIPLIFNKISDLAAVDWNSLLGNFPDLLVRIENFLEQYFASEVSSATISESITNWIAGLINFDAINNVVGSVVSGVVKTAVALFSIVFITFFFLKDENLFMRILLAVTPSKYEDNIKHAMGSISKLLSRYFIGILCESLIMMLVVSISLSFCGYGIQNAVFIGLIIGILNVIPYVGPWLGFGISLLVSIALVASGMSFPFIFFSLAITVLAAQMIDNFILQPFLYSSSVKAHPLEIFIVILMAGHAVGVVGMIFAIPAYTVLRVIGKEFFAHFKVVRKLTENMGD